MTLWYIFYFWVALTISGLTICHTLKFAAIDIGSNAIRLQVTRLLLQPNKGTSFKKLEYVRFPLRLGQDVFENGCISAAKEAQFLKLMKAFELLIDLYEVEEYYGCATSAMREAENGPAVIQATKAQTGLDIDIISGQKEAALINSAIYQFIDPEPFIHIDVGGGSTELSLFFEKQKRLTRSFPIGSVRKLNGHVTDEHWQEMQSWIAQFIAPHYPDITAIATGGNINKIFSLAHKKEGKTLSIRKVQEVRDSLANMSMHALLNELELNPDRADVIVPAADIYLAVMNWAGAKKVLVPNVGLKDGIMQQLYQKHRHKFEGGLPLGNSLL